ncbi:DUF6458 family protein [Streptomyces violascens]|uniref:DUF6458 family protein n=1 Tax=Streptomyces violascens TaxID=67381 RepID=UPI0036BD0C6C
MGGGPPWPLRPWGSCIILIAVGAILTFATDWHAKGVNLDVVGLILMSVGIIGVAVFTSVLRRRRVVPGATIIEEERRDHLT